MDEYDELLKEQALLLDRLSEVREEMRRIGNYPDGDDNYRIALRPDNLDDDPLDARTLLDDIVVSNVHMFRAEQMSEDQWWVCCYLDDKFSDRISWWLTAKARPKKLEWRTQEFPEGPLVYEHETRPNGYRSTPK